MTEDYPHLVFLSENHIDIEKLPRLLQKRIRGFEELLEDLPHTTAEDRPDLINRLDALSLEIEEDLEEHFDEHLPRVSEEESPELLMATDDSPLTVQEQEPLPESPIPPVPEQTAPIAPLPDEPAEPVIEKILGDEDIMRDLWKEGYRQLVPGTAVAKRLKTPLSERRIFIGGFCLQRRKYSSCYDISLTGE